MYHKNRISSIAYAAFFVFITLVASGCSDNPEKTVKKGVLSFDKSTTIGMAFENCRDFESFNWEYEKTDQGRTYVKFIGSGNGKTILNDVVDELKEAQKLLGQKALMVKNLLQDENNSWQAIIHATFMATFAASWDKTKHLLEDYENKLANTKSSKTEVVFLLNADESISIVNTSITLKYSDETEEKHDITPSTILDKIYHRESIGKDFLERANSYSVNELLKEK